MIKMSSRNSTVCAIYGCKNRNQKKPRKHIFFYRFPKVEDLAKKWVNASNRTDLIELLQSQNADYFYKKRFMVCSKHFELKCFRNKNLFSNGLIETAIPTKNLNATRKVIKHVPENVVVMDQVKIKVESETCHGCLSTDRRTSPLGNLNEMFVILVGPMVIKDATVICWECTAVLRRLHRFKNQLKHAQNMLLQIYNETRTLSTLTSFHKDYYDNDIKYDVTIMEKVHNLKNDFNGIKEENPIFNEITMSDFCEPTTETDDFVYNSDHQSNASDDEIKDVNVKTITSDVRTKDAAKFKISDAIKKRKLNTWKNIKKEYKSYAKHFCHKDWRKPYSQYFTKVHLDESEIEANFLRKDRKRQGYKMHLKCKDCSLIYGRQIDLDRHNNLNHHKPNASYKCLHCKEPQPSLETLKEHWRSHSVFYKCNSCSCAVFPCSLALHLSRSHVNVYACTSCTLSFSSLVSFSEHYNKNHPFVCDYCNKKCALRSVLEKHIKNHHTPLSCVGCSRRFDSHKLYRAHCREMHPDLLNIGAEPDMCYCVECDRQFPSRALYMKHVNSKHTVKPPRQKRTPCPECGKAFSKNSDMLLHYNFSHVKITKYHCDLCDKYFLKMYGLRTHMESVHLKLPKPKNKVCDLCGRAFQSNSVLDNHRRTHTGERPFKCGVCPAAFAQKGAMKIHQRKQHTT